MPIESLSELDIPVYQVISEATGLVQIIKSNPDASAPPGDYGTYSIQPIRAYGHPRTEQEDIDAIEPIPSFSWQDIRFYTITAMELMVSINFFGDSAKDNAMKMYSACFRPAIDDILRDNNIAWRYCSEARNLTYVEQATIERRYQLDLHLYAEVQATDDIYRAASVDVEVQDEDGNILASSEG